MAMCHTCGRVVWPGHKHGLSRNILFISGLEVAKLYISINRKNNY